MSPYATSHRRAPRGAQLHRPSVQLSAGDRTHRPQGAQHGEVGRESSEWKAAAKAGFLLGEMRNLRGQR